MDHHLLRPTTVETCPHRGPVDPDTGMAACAILAEVFASGRDAIAEVARGACEACCRSFPPSKACWNPVVASLVYGRASAAAETASDNERESLQRLCRAALDRLDVVYLDPIPPHVVGSAPLRPLVETLPPPPVRHGPAVRHWAVGVTTAPRLQPTLDACLGSVIRAGWPTPQLFVDSAVRIPREFIHLPGTFRDPRAGAWPNYYLALTELLLRHPQADACLLLQDDAVLYDREPLPEYLEKVLWPGSAPALVSLYCSPADCGDRPGWHARRDTCNTGPVATVFPRELARAFVTDATVFAHRWLSDPVASLAVDDVVARWASDQGLPVWFPTPSLVQHIGDTSTLWPGTRALGPRRASRFAGDPPSGDP